MIYRSFQQEDKVSYVGEKFKNALNGKEGYVVCRVQGEDNAYVVHFPEMKAEDQDYVLHAASLVNYRPSKVDNRQEKQHDVKVEQRRPKGSKKNVPVAVGEDDDE